MIKGLIVELDRERAESIKILLENKEQKMEVSVDIISATDKNFSLVDIREYDFLITNIKSINERELKSYILPYIKVIGEKTKDYLILTMTKKIVFIDKNDIIGIEVIGKDCYVYTKKKTYRLGRITLTNLLKYLNKPNIVRCHKSYAVNMNYVTGFDRDTRTRWMPDFIVETKFDGRATDTFMGDVMKDFAERNCVAEENIIIHEYNR